jgi:hypothetical protein
MKPGQEMNELVIQYIFDGKWPSIKPSESIADAWKVVNEWMSIGNCTFELYFTDSFRHSYWACEFGNGGRGFGDTAQEAICKAALLERV